MGLAKTLLLGFIAGATILLGLPVGRLRRPAPNLRALLNAVAVGILLFLVWDVLSAAWDPIDQALGSFHAGKGNLAGALGYGLLATIGLAGGLLGLVGYEEWMRRTAQRVRTRPPDRYGPGAMAAGELTARRAGLGAWLATWSAPRRLALLIAVGIGLHNFAEGLAIGQSAASGDIALATLLVVGFGLHNATEGFGIVAPLAADRPKSDRSKSDGSKSDGSESDGSESAEAVRPSWPFLLTLGLIGGGPTFVGTALGHAYTSERVAVVFLTLAAGSIIYVITQLIAIAAKTRRSDLLCYGLLVGLLAGFVTDGIVTAAGV